MDYTYKYTYLSWTNFEVILRGLQNIWKRLIEVDTQLSGQVNYMNISSSDLCIK